jgi:hypothetical protein
MTRNGQIRVQRGALRVLRLTTQVMAWAFPRKVYRGERLANHSFDDLIGALLKKPRHLDPPCL